jgi:succinate dehydrogenase / fumarate reductase, membrane anchor subunit
LNLVTPLNRVLGLGSAKGGVEDWWAQRLTAVALVLLGLWFAFALARLPDFGYATVTSWIQRPLTSILLILTLLTAMYHSHLGVRVVIEDYVHGHGAKVAWLIVSTFLHAALAIGAVFAVLRISFGASS